MSEIPALQKLAAALNPLPAAAVDGAHQMSVSGTVNIIGGGSGGTSMTDNNPFTPGSTAVTPMAGYFGGRSVASGNAAAVSIDHSGNLQVNVVAGGAGGGVANITVRGSANSDIHVGYASGAGINQDGGAYIPILGTVNVGGVVGSVNVTQGTLPLPIVGSVNVTPVASFTVNLGNIPTVNLGLGTINVGNTPNVVVTSGSIAALATGTIWVADSIQVQGTANGAIRVGFASGAGLYADGGAAIPIIGTVNTVGGGGGFATVGVYGSVNVLGTTTLGAIPTVWYGGIGADTTNSALRVNVVAGGAGGGVANLTVRGSANTDLHVGYASGAAFNQDGGAYMPVVATVNPGSTFTVNLATALDKTNDSITVYQGSAASLNVTVTGSVWIGGIGADTTNSALRVNVVAGGAGGGVANLTVVGTANTAFHVGQASTNVNTSWPQMPNVDGAAWLPVHFPSGQYPTVWYGGIGADTVNSAIRVNVVAGGAGGGVANITVRGTANTDLHVGFASTALGLWNNQDGAVVMPVFFPSGQYPTVNVTGTVNNGPIIGSVNITGSINPVGIFGSLGALVGSVNVSGSVNIAAQPIIVDTRASVTPTQWVLQAGGSGAFALINAPSGGVTGAIKISSWMLDVSATTSMMLQSPSGTNITGSIFLLPGAGYAMAGPFRSQVFQAAANATINAWLSASTSIGGWAVGWIE